MTTTYPYYGSCHCGNVKFALRMDLPVDTTAANPLQSPVRIYKCNCSTCHKAGFFHARPATPTEDFILLSPSPSELGDYKCFSKKVSWYFCKTCGVRPFLVAGEWVQDEVDVEAWAGKESKGEKQKVWKTKPKQFTVEEDGKEVKKDVHYLSVNAVALDKDDESGAPDLVEWHDKGWVFYLDMRKGVTESGWPETRYEKAYPGGMY